MATLIELSADGKRVLSYSASRLARPRLLSAGIDRIITGWRRGSCDPWVISDPPQRSGGGLRLG